MRVFVVGGTGFETVLRELPYIFGTMPGRRPLWAFLLDMLAAMGPIVLFPQKSGGPDDVRAAIRETVAACLRS